MTWSAGHSDNKAFPFRAYATFNRGWPESVDVVASVDFHRQPNGELRFSADIGFDDGEVLLDVPSGSVDIASGLLASRGEIDMAVIDITNFIEQSTSTLRKALEQQRNCGRSRSATTSTETRRRPRTGTATPPPPRITRPAS
jgi:hypothetical protein